MKTNKINSEINAVSVNLITFEGDVRQGVPFFEALEIANDLEQDLVQVSEKDGVVTCKIMDYGKFKYDKAKKAKKNHKAKVIQKEIKFRPSTDVGDINTKVNKIDTFLKANHEVKLVVQFRGREQNYAKIGFDMLHRVMEKISVEYKVKQEVNQQGRTISAIIETPQ